MCTHFWSAEVREARLSHDEGCEVRRPGEIPLECEEQVRPDLVHERPGGVLGANDTAGSLEAWIAHRIFTD